MDEREGEVWGFTYGSMYALNLQCIGLLKKSHRYGVGSTYATHRKALEALAARLKQLMDEDDD